MKDKITTEIHQGERLKTLIYVRGYSFTEIAEEFSKTNPITKQSIEAHCRQKTLNKEWQTKYKKLFGMTDTDWEVWFYGAFSFDDLLRIIAHYKTIAEEHKALAVEYKELYKSEKEKSADYKANALTWKKKYEDKGR